MRPNTGLFASIYLFWATSLFFETCLAFQAPIIYATVAKRNPSIKYLSKDDDPQESMPSGVANEPLPLSPQAIMTAQDVVTTCMDALLQNETPWENTGLEICYDYSSDRCRAALGGSLENFISYASNPTFGSMINANEYSVLNVGPMIAASMTRGAMQTVAIKVSPAKGDVYNDRTFLWTMQQERRPPRQGLWLVHECIYVENAFALTM